MAGDRGRHRLVVAIDGPSGSGKSTVAARLAAELGIAHLDTGAMYRALTWAVLNAGMDPTDAAAATRLAEQCGMELTDGAGRVEISGQDVTVPIRGPEVTAHVSAVSAHPGVRTEMVRRQRQWVAERGSAVVEGRDIGSVVFPGADLKVYLTAREEERARRRAAQQDPTGGSEPAVAADMARRDRLDSTRTASPLAVAEGATVIDTSDLSVEEIVEDLMSRL
jgi:cytidylate kinase